MLIILHLRTPRTPLFLTDLILSTLPLAHRTAASTRNKCAAQVDHLHRIRQACHRSQASPAVILVGSTLATLGSTTGTTPADPRATPYLPSPSIIPLAPPATPSVLLPLDRVRCLGFYRSALTLSPYRSVRPQVSLGRPYPYTPPNENSGSLVEAQGENDVPLKGWRTEVEF
ncbi:hypothetical protein B0H14DRAFT_3592124 [Mycena olivaceomarginata]|nr:hypothetical protein B0H14DRAFT_3592124 [Mycena olivaceomarginata]